MYLFATYVEPHEIVQCHMGMGECNVIASTSIKHMVSALLEKHNRTGVHLATNAIRLSNGQYGALMHLVRSFRGYILFSYSFSSAYPYEITHVGQSAIQLPTPVSKADFVFVTALMYVDGKIVVSYGVEDRYANFFVTDEAELFGDMDDVPVVVEQCDSASP